MDKYAFYYIQYQLQKSNGIQSKYVTYYIQQLVPKENEEFMSKEWKILAQEKIKCAQNVQSLTNIIFDTMYQLFRYSYYKKVFLFKKVEPLEPPFRTK